MYKWTSKYKSTTMKSVFIFSMLCISIMMPALAQTHNYFVEGTRWNFLVDNLYTGQSYKTYYLEGKVQIGDKECCQYLSIKEDNPNTIDSLGYISTEGDKVYIHIDLNDEEGALFYDFGMNVGDSVDVATIYNTNTIKYDNYKYLSKKTIMSCGHTYEVHEMWATEESTYTPEEFCYGDLAQWICGLGEMIYLMPYGNTGHGLGIVGGEGMSLLSVEANGETIFDRNDVTETSISLPASDPVSSVIYNLNGTRHTSSAHGLRVENGHVVWR